MNTFKLNNFVCKCGNTEVFANSSGLFCSECGIRVARYTKIDKKSYEDVLKQAGHICKSSMCCSCKIKEPCCDYDIQPCEVEQYILDLEKII